ncbi:peptidyl-prolyl cis-trans isomerase B (cyclophilin B) [Alphaproteobacteria bacterium]
MSKHVKICSLLNVKLCSVFLVLSIMISSFVLADENNQMLSSTIASKQGDFITIRIPYGSVVVQFCSDKAPNHVQRIKELVNEKFYDGLTFHRVISNFIVQTGDPKGDGTGGSNKPDLKAEINNLKHVRGTVSMARTATDLDSANSQFFVTLGDAPYLDNQYTIFGKVVYGMDLLDKIKVGVPENGGMVENPDHITQMMVGIPDDIKIDVNGTKSCGS